MASSNVCWGIEIGGGAVKALKLAADGDELKVVDFAVVQHPKVLSTPELDQSDAIRLSLGALMHQVDLAGDRVAISMPGHMSFARFAKLPPVEKKKVPDIVKFEAVQQIPFPLEEVEWDFQTFVSPDTPDVEVGIFAVTKQRINERLAMLHDVGLTPEVATISPVAAYNALALDLGFTESTPGTIILDVGTVATDMIVAEQGRVWVRTFPIGGHNFTDAVAQTFKLSYTKAEKLKREAEQTKHAKHVFQAMRPVFTDLVQEVQRSIGFYKSVHDDADLQRLIGLGSTFRLPGLRKYLKQQLGLDVYRMEQFKKLSIDGPRAGEFQASSLNLSTAYGLALQGLGRATLLANLMPVPVMRTAMWRKKVPWFGVAAGLGVAAGGAMFIRPIMDSMAFQAAEKPLIIETVAIDARQLKNEADEAQVTSGAEPDLRASHIVGLLDHRGLYAQLLDDAGRALAAAGGGESSPDLAVSGLTMKYVGSGTGDDEDDSFSQPDPYGGRTGPGPGLGVAGRGGGGGRIAVQPPRGGGGVQPTAVTDKSLEQLKGKAHVRVEMVLQTAMPRREAEDLVQRSVEKWLRDNARRDGVSYTVVLSDIKPFVYADVVGGVGTGSTRRAAARTTRGSRGSPGLTSSKPPPGLRSGLPTSTPSSSSGTARSYSSGDLDKIAPLGEGPQGQAEPTGAITISWYAVLAGEQGGDS